MQAKRVESTQPGFALVTTVVVMMLVGAFVTIGFYRAPPPAGPPPTAAEQAAAAAAQAGVHEVMQTWDATKLTTLKVRRDMTMLGSRDHDIAAPADYVVSIGRSGPAQFTITATGSAGEAETLTYCTIVVRTHLKSGRLAERGAAISRTCRAET